MFNSHHASVLFKDSVTEMYASKWGQDNHKNHDEYTVALYI